MDNLKIYLLLGILCLVSIKSFAHDPNEAYFTIDFQGDSCFIEAEFPWAFRNALLKEFPNLEEQKSTEAFQEAVKKYLQKYFILNKDGKVLTFQLIQRKGSHSHSVKYILTFYIKGFQKLEFENTCMFNLYNNQVNHHTINWENKQYQVETNSKQVSFAFDKNPENLEEISFFQTQFFSYTILFFLVVLVAISLYLVLRKRS